MEPKEGADSYLLPMVVVGFCLTVMFASLLDRLFPHLLGWAIAVLSAVMGFGLAGWVFMRCERAARFLGMWVVGGILGAFFTWMTYVFLHWALGPSSRWNIAVISGAIVSGFVFASWKRNIEEHEKREAWRGSAESPSSDKSRNSD